jgi:hypothetical protein
MTLEQIHELQGQVLEDNRRWREQQRRYELHQMQIHLAIETASLQYAFAVGSMWAAALRPAFDVVDCSRGRNATRKG